MERSVDTDACGSAEPCVMSAASLFQVGWCTRMG